MKKQKSNQRDMHKLSRHGSFEGKWSSGSVVEKAERIFIDMIQGSGYVKFQVSIVFRLRKPKRQSRRCTEITQKRQLWRQVVFRVFFRRSRKSIHRYDLGEWVC